MSRRAWIVEDYAILTRIASILLLLSFASLALAEPLDPARVSAQAKWLIHLDADALQASHVGKSIRAALRQQPAFNAATEKARTGLGIDLMADIRDITAYGTSYKPDGGVLVVRGRYHRERVVSLLQKAPNLRTSEWHGHTVYSWSEENSRSQEQSPKQSFGAFAADDTLVIGPGETNITAALDVLDGKESSLHGTDSPLSRPAPEGTVLRAGAIGLATADLPAQSPVVRQCESASLALGEKDDQAFVQGELVTNSEQVANQMRALIQGVQAMAELHASDHPDLAKLFMPLAVSAQGRAVRVDWHMADADLLDVIASQLHCKLGEDSQPHEPGKQP